MTRGPIRKLLLWLGLASLLAGAAPALARDFAPGSICHTAISASEDYTQLAAHPERWNCGPSNWSIASQRALVRFDLRHAGAPLPAQLTTRLTRFDAMRLTVIGSDGRTMSRDFGASDMIPATNDWYMKAPIPTGIDRPAAVVMRVDGARHAAMLASAQLVAAKPGAAAGAEAPRDLTQELLLAALCGALFMPLIFNFAFYGVLRERFLLWHSITVLFMISQTMVTSGLINRFAALTLDQISLLSVVTWGGGVIAAAMFSADLLEEGTLDPFHRRAMRLTAPWIIGWSAFYFFAGGSMRALASPLYYASFLPVLALFAWIMVVARRRGSRAVNFQIAAWLPIMLTGLVRVVTQLGLGDAPLEMQMAQHVSIGLEVMITSLGVADRFMAIKRQRDRAWADARQFEDMAGRDPLTGLLNRRGIEDRFPVLHAAGFRSMASIDLDHFKDVNDGHGHAVGDAVLRVVAEALSPDADTLAVRMGGEEFLLLFRGQDVAERAERRRRAIAVRIAAAIPGLPHVVTASMGVVEHDADDGLQPDFTGLYAQCDRLLYEAKHAGRNRTMRERVQDFASLTRRVAAA